MRLATISFATKVGDVSELGFLVRFRSDTSRCPQQFLVWTLMVSTESKWEWIMKAKCAGLLAGLVLRGGWRGRKQHMKSIAMSYKSVLANTANAKLRLPTLGLAGLVAMAAAAGPAAAQLALETYIPVPAWSSRRGIRKPERSSFLFRPSRALTQAGSPRSALLAMSCERSLWQAWASHRARPPDSPLAGAAT